MAISASELASIQAEAAKWTCDKLGTIYRDLTATHQASTDAYGSSTSSALDTGNYTLMHSNVPVGVTEPTSTHLQNYDYLIAAEKTWLVHMPVGTDLLERDHVVLESQVLEVHVILTPRSYPALLSALCAEVA